MTPKFFDIHSHIQFPQFEKDKAEVFGRMEEHEVATLVVGIDAKSSLRAITEAEEKEYLFATVGLHPNDVFKEAFDVSQYRTLAQHEKVVAIGECGLDYFRIKKDELRIKKKQKEVLEQHIELAIESDLPLMLHGRATSGTMDAYGDMLEILTSYFKIHNSTLRGNVHFFAGSLDIAKRFLEIGFTLSFTGVLTFTHDYDEVVKCAPSDMIMSETDSPFAAPVPHRGGRNEPAYVVEVVKKIAEIRGDNFETVRKQLVLNTKRVFDI